MERFFIDVIDGGTRHEDEIGEVTSIEHASADAVVALLDLFRQDLASIEERRAVAEVRNVNGRIVYVATLNFTGRLHV